VFFCVFVGLFCLFLLLVMARPVSSGKQVKSGSGVFRFGEIRVEYISVLRVSDRPNGFRAPFPRLFRFLSK